jgi:hypothetical protein
MEYNSALKKKEILSLAVTWLKLEDITLSEISQEQTKTARAHSSENSKTMEAMEAEGRFKRLGVKGDKEALVQGHNAAVRGVNDKYLRCEYANLLDSIIPHCVPYHNMQLFVRKHFKII